MVDFTVTLRLSADSPEQLLETVRGWDLGEGDALLSVMPLITPVQVPPDLAPALPEPPETAPAQPEQK